MSNIQTKAKLKYFLRIFTVYFLALTLLPCDDMHERFIENNSNDLAFFDSFHNHQETSDLDICSPFCGCACCGNTLQVIDNELFISKSFFKFSTNQAKNSTFHSFDFSSFWQPPKVV